VLRFQLIVSKRLREPAAIVNVLDQILHDDAFDFTVLEHHTCGSNKKQSLRRRRRPSQQLHKYSKSRWDNNVSVGSSKMASVIFLSDRFS
jgi:hypothetical protein